MQRKRRKFGFVVCWYIKQCIWFCVYIQVTDKGFWEDFLEAYGFKVFPVTLAYGLQKVYQR